MLDLNNIPKIEVLRKKAQSLAVLDAILSPEWEYRRYSYDNKWDKNEEVASMRVGSGDFWFAQFSEVGAVIHGSSKESEFFRSGQPRSRIWNELPRVFHSFRDEPAFRTNESSYCLWRRMHDNMWLMGKKEYKGNKQDPDGSISHLEILYTQPAYYVSYARKYFEVTIPESSVVKIYNHKQITKELLMSLNTELSLDNLKSDLDEIGYLGAG